MKEYRAFHIDDQNRLRGSKEFGAPSDGEAMIIGTRVRKAGYSVEVWDRAGKVGMVPADVPEGAYDAVAISVGLRNAEA